MVRPVLPEKFRCDACLEPEFFLIKEMNALDRFGRFFFGWLPALIWIACGEGWMVLNERTRSRMGRGSGRYCGRPDFLLAGLPALVWIACGEGGMVLNERTRSQMGGRRAGTG